MDAIIAKKKEEELKERDLKVSDPFAVKLSNMPNCTTEEDIKEAMAIYGEVKKCRIPTNRETGRPLGFAIVVFGTIE